ncbi:MAG TPA: WYL domain-containing protein [Acidimicrobiales bacterium]|nr:WYL domain-containing protein [Acidimicrobiales bacterium]
MGRPSADDRLRRLLALVPWVVANDGPSIEEVCTRFDLTEAELIAELDLVFLCGVHPFTPDSLMEVDVGDGRVWIRYADYFDQPLRLTPEDGLALVAAGTALLAVPGAEAEGPLARALEKVAAVLGIDTADALDVELGVAPAGVLELLRQAVAENRQVEIDYYAYGRDTRTRRVVDPHGVFAADGEWYLHAWCHLATAPRRFRVDRIRGLDLLDQGFDPPATAPDLAVYDPRADDPRVVLDLAPAARWVVEQYPVESVEERSGGRTRVTLAVSERAWLERLLLRLGPSATVVSGASGTAAAAAARVLDRYTSR